MTSKPFFHAFTRCGETPRKLLLLLELISRREFGRTIFTLDCLTAGEGNKKDTISPEIKLFDLQNITQLKNTRVS